MNTSTVTEDNAYETVKYLAAPDRSRISQRPSDISVCSAAQQYSGPLWPNTSEAQFSATLERQRQHDWDPLSVFCVLHWIRRYLGLFNNSPWALLQDY